MRHDTPPETGLVVERRGPVGWLVFDRPASANAMHAPLIAALPAAWRELDADPHVRAIVVTGRGFTSNESVMRPDVGLSLGVRLNWRAGNVDPWIGVGLDIWPLGQQARVAGWPDGRPLPRFEPRIGIGITALTWQ